VFADRHTVRVMGKVIPHGKNRVGFPAMSRYEERRKANKRTTGGTNWSEAFLESGMTEQQVDAATKQADETARATEESVKTLRKDLAMKEAKQCAASVRLKQLQQALKVRSGDNKQDVDSPTEGEVKSSYRQLQQARDDVREVRRSLLPKDGLLRQQRAILYQWNHLQKAAKSITTTTRRNRSSSVKKAATMTTPTWQNFNVEDSIESLDVANVVAGQDDKRRIVLSGTDYGLCVMSVTVPQTIDEILTHSNRFHVLSGELVEEISAYKVYRANTYEKLTLWLYT